MPRKMYVDNGFVYCFTYLNIFCNILLFPNLVANSGMNLRKTTVINFIYFISNTKYLSIFTLSFNQSRICKYRWSKFIREKKKNSPWNLQTLERLFQTHPRCDVITTWKVFVILTSWPRLTAEALHLVNSFIDHITGSATYRPETTTNIMESHSKKCT